MIDTRELMTRLYNESVKPEPETTEEDTKPAAGTGVTEDDDHDHDDNDFDDVDDYAYECPECNEVFTSPYELDNCTCPICGAKVKPTFLGEVEEVMAESANLSEVTVKVHGGKVFKLAKKPKKGFKLVNGKYVKMSAKEIKARKKSAKKMSKKAHTGAANKARVKSMKKRASFEALGTVAESILALVTPDNLEESIEGVTFNKLVRLEAVEGGIEIECEGLKADGTVVTQTVVVEDAKLEKVESTPGTEGEPTPKSTEQGPKRKTTVQKSEPKNCSVKKESFVSLVNAAIADVYESVKDTYSVPTIESVVSETVNGNNLVIECKGKYDDGCELTTSFTVENFETAGKHTVTNTGEVFGAETFSLTTESVENVVESVEVEYSIKLGESVVEGAFVLE